MELRVFTLSFVIALEKFFNEGKDGTLASLHPTFFLFKIKYHVKKTKLPLGWSWKIFPVPH